jgi:hypothetical protein
VFRENSATGEGGGGYITGPCVVTRCEFSGNTAGVGGGLLVGGWIYASLGVEAEAVSQFPEEGTARVVDSVIFGNLAAVGGGLHSVEGDLSTVYAAVLEVVGSTITGNRATRAGGVGVAEKCSVDLHRTIVWGNCSDSSAAIVLEDSTSSFTATCSALDTTDVSGPGTVSFPGPQIVVDPEFCAPSSCTLAPTTTGLYTLQSSSPCLPTQSPCDSLVGALGDSCGTLGTPEEAALPARLVLSPNPSRGSVGIRLAGVESTAGLVVGVFDISGRLVRSLRTSQSPSLVWDGRDHNGRSVPSGIYFVQVRGAGVRILGRVVLLK